MAGILEGKVALITGAGSGIGRATSRIFAREGAKLVLADVVEEGVVQTHAMIGDTGGVSIFLKADVSKPGDVESAVAKAVEKYGRIDCAFNNAGIEGQSGLTHECTEENWNRVIAINLTGVWLCMKAEIAQMLKQGGGGAIVNTSSGAGLIGVSGMPAYVAAKHGVAGLTRAAAIEYGRHNIRVNAVCPGPIRTPMMERLLGNRPEAEQRFARGGPLKRLGEAEEIGEAVAWLCSDHASYVTGLPMPVDGGFLAQ
ncbi:MAG: SDR family oxidoreductase [Candidatus Binatus sp.]|uniref:glucose 1-dehydrogenase n=1 Tax=Candidatus Binatus sp. TaxID=2811406 RepID=UPI00271EE51C|nr:glucose 1-dehydrogenase [Candidatus Binatus sp.]MDO8434021.1 SDR family oxidoreductase [Candidatus Binatus sp.]